MPSRSMPVPDGLDGVRVLHLQCHFGMDTLSWARLGASVTGVDYSEQAIRAAGELAAECGLEGRFICCNLYDLPAHLDGQFDIVYTSYGVLCWLPDLREWARIAASYVKPGGFFYIAEFHPFAYVFDDEADHEEHSPFMSCLQKPMRPSASTNRSR